MVGRQEHAFSLRQFKGHRAIGGRVRTSCRDRRPLAWGWRRRQSYEVGAVKPQPEIFARADLLNMSAGDALMVGDSWRVDARAAAVGIRTLILPQTSGPSHGLEAVLRLVGAP